MSCIGCGHARMKVERRDYVYDAGGLDVRLIGLKHYVCPLCGEEEAEIPHVETLNRLIARQLITKSGHLVGSEIRFLRKLVGLSGTDFGHLLGAAKETVSRWENDKQPIAHGHEHALRALAARLSPIEDYELFDSLRKLRSTKRAKALEIRIKPGRGRKQPWALAA